MTLQRGTRVLVTSVVSYIGVHIADQFLRAGCIVFGTAQTGERTDHIVKYFARYGLGKFSIQEIGYPAYDNVYDIAVQGVDIIAHVPHVIPSHQTTDPMSHIINPSVNSMLTLLHSAHQYGSHVKHIIINSSLASVLHLDTKPGYEYAENDWNDWATNQVQRNLEAHLSTDAVTAYCASKNEAERAVWKFQSTYQPRFSITTIIPSYVVGPIIPLPESESDIEGITSIRHLIRYFAGEPQNSRLNSFGGNFVSVVDVAIAHVGAAHLGKAVNGERFILAAGHFCFQQLADILRTNFPERRDIINEGNPGKYTSAAQLINGSKAQRMLGIEYADIEQVIVHTVNSLKHLY